MKLFAVLVYIGFLTKIALADVKCESDFALRAQGAGKDKIYGKGSISVPTKDAAVLTVIGKGRKIAKFYPQQGLDAVIFDKKYFLKKEPASWVLFNSNNQPVVSCELRSM